MAKSSLLIEMIELLRGHPGISVDELAASLGRSERTIYRWLNEISVDLKLPLTCLDGGYYLHDDQGNGHVNFDPQEVMALWLSLKSAPFVGGPPVKQYAESAWQKIRQAVTWNIIEEARDLSSTHGIIANASREVLEHGIVEALESAINLRHRVRATYRSQKSRQVKQYAMDPYAVVFRRHSWYLLAFSEEHDKVVQFRLNRFHSVIDTGETFEVPDDFSIAEHFRLSWEAWGGGEPTKIKVWFSPDVAEMVSESKRHSTQVVHPQPDGSIIFQATVSSIEEIAIWIMGYGQDATVLEPHSLRDYVLDHARGMVARYSE